MAAPQAPKVQSIEQIVNDLNPAYRASTDVLNQRRSQIPGQFQAQRQGLEAEKVQGFNTINTQANARGMAFSGIPLDEQANYLSTKYLPGLTNLAQQENDANLALDEALAKINQERRLKAMDIRQGQQSSLEKFLADQQQLAWDREKFNAQMKWDKERLAKEQAFTASQNAAERAASSAGQGTLLQNDIYSSLLERQGVDRFVSPTTFNQLRQYATNNGMSAAQFNSMYSTFANAKDPGGLKAYGL